MNEYMYVHTCTCLHGVLAYMYVQLCVHTRGNVLGGNVRRNVEGMSGRNARRNCPRPMDAGSKSMVNYSEERQGDMGEET